MNKQLWSLLLLGWLLMIVGPALAFGAEQASSLRAKTITREDIEHAITQAMAEEKLGEHFSFQFREQIPAVIAEYQQDVKAYVHEFRVDTNKRSFATMMVIEADGKPLSPMRLSGRYIAMQSLPVLTRALERKDIIREQDLTTQLVAVDRIRSDVITDNTQLVGKEVKQTISPGRMIRKNEISSPALVMKNKPITLVYRTKNMAITAMGIAQDDGADGDVIRVRNADSSRTVQAIVRSNGEAEAITSANQHSSLANY